MLYTFDHDRAYWALTIQTQPGRQLTSGTPVGVSLRIRCIEYAPGMGVNC
jgi:hypothetical protein